jgi:hypothetical protein
VRVIWLGFDLCGQEYESFLRVVITTANFMALDTVHGDNVSQSSRGFSQKLTAHVRTGSYKTSRESSSVHPALRMPTLLLIRAAKLSLRTTTMTSNPLATSFVNS